MNDVNRAINAAGSAAARAYYGQRDLEQRLTKQIEELRAEVAELRKVVIMLHGREL